MKCKRKPKMQKGVFSFFMIWIILLIFLVILFAFSLPAALNITTKMYVGGENQLIKAEQTCASIQDANARETICGSIESAKNAQIENIDTMSMFVQYSPFIIILIILGVIILIARQNVEVGGQLL